MEEIDRRPGLVTVLVVPVERNGGDVLAVLRLLGPHRHGDRDRQLAAVGVADDEIAGGIRA